MTAATDLERDRVGPYRLVAAIGAGGSARIDLARIDRAYNFQRHVVIKRPLEHLRGDASVAASLRREARIGGRLRHPNLVAVLDAGIHDGYDYLALEYVHGASLRTLMQTETAGRVRTMPLPVALGIAIDIARGMHDAHELADTDGTPLGLVHRDVSPGNVLIGHDGAIKLADFGIAKETRVSTLSGSMHGTVTYMAPEQCRGHAFDRRADVFSLGVILYELITETRLFWADNDVASLHRVLSGNVPRPRKVNPALPAALEELVMTAVAHDPDKRFATARALADALEQLAAAEGLVVGARGLARMMEARGETRRVPWVAATAIVPPARADARAQIPDPTPPGDGSLVEIIASAPADEPLSPTFGPSEDGADEAALPPPRPARRSTTQLAIVIAIGLVLGSVATVLVMNRLASPDREPAEMVIPATPAHLTSPSVELSKSADGSGDRDPVPTQPSAPESTPVPSPPQPPPNRLRQPVVNRRPVVKSPTDVKPPVTPEPPAPDPAPTQGSAAELPACPRDKRDWDPSDPLFRCKPVKP